MRTYRQIILLTTLHCLCRAERVDIHGTREDDMNSSEDPSSDMGFVSRVACSDSFIPIGDKCVYFATEFSMDHTESRDLCEVMGGNLLAIQTATQLKDIIAYIRGNGYSSASFWVDGTDTADEGHWQYTSGSAVPRRTPFWMATEEKQQPDDYGTEDCLTMEDNYGFLLNDRPCDDKFAPLCEHTPMEILESKISAPVLLDCPDWYVPIGDTCVAFLLWMTETWTDARQTCQSLDGELAVVNDIELMRSIVLYIHQQGIASHSFWLGGSDINQEDNWVWGNGSATPRGQPFWAYNEPQGGTSEDCLAMNSDGYHYFRDKNCDTHMTPMCTLV